MQIVTAGASKTRHSRRPVFPIAGVMKPFGLYPLMIHPVLPGETINDFSCKMRALSLPVKNPLTGAWLETWLAYVKFTDLDRELGQMFISDTFPTTGYLAGANNDRTFTAAGQVDWVGMCVKRIHETYFLNEGETARTIDGVPQTKLVNTNWTQNLMFQPAGIDEAQLPSNPDVQLTGFQMMQMMQMSEMTYEKYLAQYGVQSITAGIGKPEIFRYTRSWTQPTNAVEPSTGVPSSAWAWSDEIKMEKPRRFDEPGFIIMLGCIRPKMFQKNLRRSVVGNMWGFADWFPAYNLQDPAGGIRQVLTSDPVFEGTWDTAPLTTELLYDHRDILNHGEQFINEWTAPPYAWPFSTGQVATATATPEDLRGEYAKAADVDALFTGATADRRFCYYEGIAETRIAGHLKDTTL